MARIDRTPPSQPAGPTGGVKKVKLNPDMLETRNKVVEVADRALLPPLHSVQKRPSPEAKGEAKMADLVAKDQFGVSDAGKRRRHG